MQTFFRASMDLSSIESVVNRYRLMLKKSNVGAKKWYHEFGVTDDEVDDDDDDENDAKKDNSAISSAKSSIDEIEKMLNNISVEERKYLGELFVDNTSMTSQFVNDCAKTAKTINEIIKDVDNLLKSNVTINDKTKNIITSNTKEISQIVSRYYKIMADAYFK